MTLLRDCRLFKFRITYNYQQTVYGGNTGQGDDIVGHATAHHDQVHSVIAANRHAAEGHLIGDHQRDWHPNFAIEFISEEPSPDIIVPMAR